MRAAGQRRIERQGAQPREHDQVAIGLEARGQRPVDLLVGEDVDVGIDHEHVLDVGERTEAGGDGVARLARHALADGHPHVEHAAARRRRIDGERLAHRDFERAPDHHFGAQGRELRGVGARERAAADGRGLEQRVGPARDRGQVKHRVALDRAVIAEELAVGPLRLDMAARIEIALQHPFGIGRHADVVGHALDHRQRRVAQRRDQAKLVDGKPHGRRHVIDRMRADHEAHRQRRAARGARLIERAQVARRHEVDAGLAPAAQHQPADADIGPAGPAVDHIVDRRRNIGTAVGAVLEMHRQRGQVGIIGEHDLLHRRLGTRYFDDLGLVAQAPLHFRQKLVGRDAERERDARPAAGHAADELLPFGAGGAEPHRLRVAFEHGRDIGEVDRRVPRFKLAGLRQAREESAQPEPLEIHGLGRLGAGRLHDLHGVFQSLHVRDVIPGDRAQ